MTHRLNKTFAASLFLAMALALPAAAQAPEMAPAAEDVLELAAPEPESAEPGFAQTATPAMWRVTDADSEFILLGTFHILPPALDWRSDALEAAFANADVYYFETDPTDPAQLENAQTLVRMQGVNPPGVGLSAMLQSADSDKLFQIAKQLGVNYIELEKLRPWNAFISLSVRFIMSKGFEPGAGVDSVLLAEAKASGKEVRYFETLTQQVTLFTELDPKTERDLLLVTIRDWDAQDAAFDDLFNAWARGDADFIDQNMNKDMRELAPVAYQTLIIERNAEWAVELDAALKNGSGKALVSVGAAHLVGGEQSVPGLLATKGYEVTRYGVGGETAPEAANDNEPE